MNDSLLFTLNLLLFTTAGFFLGAIPFSLLIGRYWLGVDIRNFGDHNPGATNVYRAGGFFPFSAALLLDISKGALPVGLAWVIFQFHDWRIVPIALAPPLGHAFSPFLRWQGGKSIAAAFGAWIGLTLWQMPLVALPLLVFWSLLIRPSAWAVMLTLIGMLVALLFWLTEPLWLVVWLGHTTLLIYNHREELRQAPRLKLAA